MYNTKQLRFAHRAFAVLVALFLAVSAFAQENPASNSELVITTQPIAISIVPTNQLATLSFVAEKGDDEVSYQWYQSIDGTTETGIKLEGASENSYITEVFTDREIRYYYCVANIGEEKVTSNVVVVANTGLPVLYINTEVPIGKITKDEYVFGDMKLVYENGEEFAYEFKKIKDGEKKEGVKGRGNTSWGMPKKGYSIKFDSKQSLFGLPKSKKWCIVANYSDKTLLRNKFASVLGNEIFNSEWNPHFYSVDVVWNGEYQGNYIFCERNVIGEGRIDIQDISDYGGKKFTDQNGDGEIDLYDGGFVLEIDERKDASYWFTTTKKVNFTFKDPDEVSEDVQEHVKNIVQTAENILYSDIFADEEDGWRKYIDEKSVIDWYVINELSKNNDAQFYSSVYIFYKPTNNKIYLGPNWDFDISFGNVNHNKNDNPSGWWIKNSRWISRMFDDPLFIVNVKNRWNEKKENLNEIVSSEFQSLANANAVSAECNFKKWKILGEYVWPNPAGYKNRTTYQSEIDYMKNWLDERIVWLDNVIKNSYIITYNLDGGSLTKNNPEVFISQSTDAFTLNNPTKDGFVFNGWSGSGIKGLLKTVKVTDDGKGDKSFTANWGQGIDVANLDITIVEDDEFVYDGAKKEPIVVVTDGDNTLSLNTDYNVSYINNVGAGTAKVIIMGIGNYAGIQEKTFTITPKPVVLTVTGASKTYGDKDPTLEYSVEGLVTVNGVKDELKNVSLEREAGEYAGEYAITATIDADANPNYTVTKKDGLFTINPDATEIIVSVKGHSKSLEFNGQKQSVSGFEMTSSNKDYSLEFVSYTGDSLAAGTDAQTYVMGLSINDFKNTSVNYSNVVFDVVDGSLSVTPKPVVLTVTGASKTYGDKDPAFEYSVKGLVTVNGVKDELKNVSLERETGENVGEYAITATIDADANPNYTVTKKDGLFTINPDATEIIVSVKGHSKSLEFNGQKQSVSGFDMTSNNDAFSLKFVSYTGDSLVAGTDAKSYAMGLSAKDFKNASINYSNVVFDVTDGSLSVTPKPVVLTVTGASKTYGDKDPALKYSVEGLVTVNGVEDKLKNVTLARKTGEDVGDYAVTATVDAKSNPNYTVTAKDGKFTIKPNATEIIVSVKGHSKSLEFNGQKQSVSGFDMTSNSDVFSLKFVSYTGDSLAAGTDAQTYAMGLSAKDFKNTSVNYSNVVFEVSDGSLSVTPKPVVLTVTGASKTYGDKDPALEYSVEGLVTVNGVEDKLKNVTLARNAGENAGDYAVTATVDAKSNPNYTVTAKVGKFTITPKPVVLTVTGASKTYGDKDPALKYSVEGLVTVNGVEDKLKNVTLARKAGENAGDYAVTATVDAKSNPNYTVTAKDGKLTITPNASKIVVTVKGHRDTVEYNGKKQTVRGFDMTCNNKSYSLSFVRYTGDSLASGTKVKTYSMGLVAKDFKNTSANYSNVVFEITDGSLTIEEQKKKDAIIALRENVSRLKVSVVNRNVQIYSTMVGERFTVFDVQGSVIRKGFVESANFEIPVAKPGVYMVRVGTLTQRICIK